MNLIDAIKSGKPFRRAGTVPWQQKHFLQSELTCTPADTRDLSVKKVIDLSLDDLLADDWQILEPTVTITRSQFWEAARQSWIDDRSTAEFMQDMKGKCLGDLARYLGLGDK